MEWGKGVEVRRFDNPGKTGVTTGNTRARPSGLYVQVRWHQDGNIDYEAEDQIECIEEISALDPYQVLAAARFGRAADLRRSLTQEHLSGRLANLVYAMGVTTTDFYPHQYKPLLTLLDSPATGLLIADEVGLGKTIEAGLIWTELRAREDMRRLLVVCPAMLVDKWRRELRVRFGIEANAVTAAELESELRSANRSGPMKAWVASYHALRPPKSWRLGEADGKNRSGRSALADYLAENEDAEPLVDLVVFDEAHYMRNPASAANRLGGLVRAVAQYQTLLSATPINLADQDLFQLLHLCDPDQFPYLSTFREMIEANEPVVRARDLVLRTDSTPAEVHAAIREAAAMPLLQGSRQLASMLEADHRPEDFNRPGYRAELANALERMNLLGRVLTRTRKRDIQMHRPKREVRRESVPMTPAEREFYEFVTEITREYAWKRGISDGFLLATPQRQVCSCPAAFARAWAGDSTELIQDTSEMLLEEVEELDGEGELEEISASLKDFLWQNRPRFLDISLLERTDSKFGRLVEVLAEYFRQNPSEKAVIFTSYRGTARYLLERLRAQAIGSMLVWGNMKENKDDLISEFESRQDVRVLISTEVAAEGVDLQFCRLLINYDLPWNPMRVEQRIGRIDRLGQTAEKIHVWNLFYEQTIDERILGRLLERLEIFTNSLGTPEPVVGEIIQRLEAKLLTSDFSEKEQEARIAEAAQILENIRVQQEELEANAAQMIAHGGLVMERIAAAQELARRVTEQDLVIYVRDYLQRTAPGHRFDEDPSNASRFTIQLPPALAENLEEYTRRTGMTGLTRLVDGMPRQCRFLNKVGGAKQGAEERIHQFHPLVRFIANSLKDASNATYPVVALTLPHDQVPRTSPGQYMFLLRRWVFDGVKSEEVLASSALNIRSGELLDPESADALVNAARLFGGDWLEVNSVLTHGLADILDTLEDHLKERYRVASGQKQDENTDRATFQLRAIESHLGHRLRVLNETRARHEMLNRPGLVKATEGKIEKLKVKLELKRAHIERQRQVEPDNRFVCCGIVDIREVPL